ncbi:MAG: T9SS type A sorting domain-containing protein [Bacteroidia bacterium]
MKNFCLSARKVKSLFFTFLILSPILCFSQNLVPNGDFERFTSLPNAPGQVFKCSGWSNLNDNSATINGSPDFLHDQGTGNVNLPFAGMATVYPYSGSGITGLITRHASNFREYISAKLNSPMVPGTTYLVSFWITNGQSNHYYGYSSDRIGIRFSVDSLMQIGGDPILATPQIEIAGEVWSTSWINYTFPYTADSAYEHITIGNFYDESLTSFTQQVSSNISNAYYFFDKIEVSTATGLSEANNISFFIFPNPSTDKLYISTTLQEIGIIEIFDITGKKIKEIFMNGNSGDIDINALENGFYLLRIGEQSYKIFKQ